MNVNIDLIATKLLRLNKIKMYPSGFAWTTSDARIVVDCDFDPWNNMGHFTLILDKLDSTYGMRLTVAHNRVWVQTWRFIINDTVRKIRIKMDGTTFVGCVLSGVTRYLLRKG